MHLSNIYFKTHKEMPKDAAMPSHSLLLKAGFINMSSAGIYTYMPLMQKVMIKIAFIIREEMNRIGGQEMLMPALTPAQLWKETGRWDDFGDEMFRLKDRNDRQYALCPTHEEVITDIARNYFTSYRQLPQIWYQIQLKFRDEPRPRSGLLRVRQFEMKDSYSFDRDNEGLDISYNKHREAYEKIFERCSIEYTIVEAASGLMGGAKSEEFMAPSDSGEDEIFICDSCGYSANSEVAKTIPPHYETVSNDIEEIHTPVNGDVESVSSFLSRSKEEFIKSILIILNDKPSFLLVPGNRDINEAKIDLALKGKWRYAESSEIKNITGAGAGYISPVGLNIDVYADSMLTNASNMISGANKDHYHITGIDIKRDISAENLHFVDIASVVDGDTCPQCRKGELRKKRAIEIGHIFQLGTKYSKSMNALYQDEDGSQKVIVMGSYGIGLGRIVSTVIEQNHDERGIVWPTAIAPFKVIILNLSMKDETVANEAEKLYSTLNKAGIETLLDDRDTGAGVKFNDADLIGIPVRIVIGRKFKETGKLEISSRTDSRKEFISRSSITETVRQMLNNSKGKKDVSEKIT